MKRTGPGALLLLAAVFAVATVGKLVEVAAVMAQENGQAEAAAPPSASVSQPDPVPAAVECDQPATLDDALGRALASRAKQLDEREAKLNQLSLELEAGLTALQKESARLVDARVAKAGEADAQLQRLVALYETMKPKAAAAIFEEMDIEIAARLLASLQEEQASFILGSMEPRRAYALTVALSNELLARLDEGRGAAGEAAR